jgi:hypothetical protein
LESYQSDYFLGTGRHFGPHKTALFATISHFRGTVVCGQANSRLENAKIANETNDLANLLDATSSKNVEQN